MQLHKFLIGTGFAVSTVLSLGANEAPVATAGKVQAASSTAQSSEQEKKTYVEKKQEKKETYIERKQMEQKEEDAERAKLKDQGDKKPQPVVDPTHQQPYEGGERPGGLLK